MDRDHGKHATKGCFYFKRYSANVSFVLLSNGLTKWRKQPVLSLSKYSVYAIHTTRIHHWRSTNRMFAPYLMFKFAILVYPFHFCLLPFHFYIFNFHNFSLYPQKLWRDQRVYSAKFRAPDWRCTAVFQTAESFVWPFFQSPEWVPTVAWGQNFPAG